MRPLCPVLLALALAGCTAGGGRAHLADCRETPSGDIDASLRFAGTDFEPAWQSRCDEGRTRVFRAVTAGSDDEPKHLVTLTRYPDDTEAKQAVNAYIARSQASRVGEPRVFERADGGGRKRYFVELMLRRDDAPDLEYVLHGVTTGDTGSVVSATYTQRFQAADAAALERIKRGQDDWVRGLERLLAGFPPR